MKKISGNIFNSTDRKFIRGNLYFDNKILSIEEDLTVKDTNYILPGLIDSHIHIESSMLSPFEYSKEALKHGVVAAITDPHEIANVCGMDGIEFMITCAEQTPMKIYTGIPSCVPATDFECSGSIIGIEEIEELFIRGKCSHLSEMMNFPGVIFDDPVVLKKIKLAQKFGKRIDGHAPMLSGKELKKYVDAGISTDHECININEALEKILLGMKIMLRESSASRDFDNLDKLIQLHPKSILFCTDDCHPEELKARYIDDLVRRSLNKGYSIYNILNASTKNAIDHYSLNVGFLRPGDEADFIVVDDLSIFSVLKTFINGMEVFDGNQVTFSDKTFIPINQFYCNDISKSDLQVKAEAGKELQIIQVVQDSLLTKHISVPVVFSNDFIESDIVNDILKIVVVNRYQNAKPAVGFIKGFGLKTGAIGGSVAHDSHNIIVIGTDDVSILKAIQLIQQCRGGLVVVNDETEKLLPLPIAGLMSDKSLNYVAGEYKILNKLVLEMGSKLKAPFMTMAFMALLVIPEIKLGDRGLFDGNKFQFIELQS
jgi:adenine deaminase